MRLPLHTQVLEEPRTRSILCVQPDREMRAALQQALSSYNLVLVSTGLEAIRHLQTTTFDAYVLDYRLPPTSGIHLCRHIRRSDPHSPVCFYTDAGSEQQRNRAEYDPAADTHLYPLLPGASIGAGRARR